MPTCATVLLFYVVVVVLSLLFAIKGKSTASTTEKYLLQKHNIITRAGGVDSHDYFYGGFHLLQSHSDSNVISRVSPN